MAAGCSIATPCSGTKPTFAKWICDEFAPPPRGMELGMASIPWLKFNNLHLFEFSKGGIPVGVGRFGSERIRMRSKIDYYVGSPAEEISVEYVLNKGNGLLYYETGAPIICANTCRGQRAIIPDLYSHAPGGFSIQRLVSEQRFPKPYSGQVKYKAEFTWENQLIYVDRVIGSNGVGSGGTVLLGPIPTKKLVYEYTFQLSVDAQGSVLSGPQYSPPTVVLQW
jgi:hypothetical protein